MMDVAALKEKVVVIIGASRGIGYATAKRLNEQGTKLVLGARHVEHVKEEFTRDDVQVIEVDVTYETSVKQFVDQSIDYFKHIDVLINAAGMGVFENVTESKTEDFDQMLAVNLRGTYLSCKYFGRLMRHQGDGQILNLVSIAGTTALPGNGGYTASKFGVLGLTRVLQAELRQHGVRITSVLPGAVNSSFWDRAGVELDVNNMIPVESLAEHICYLLLQPKHSVIDEITIMPPDGIL